jgi:hypothetical protein
VTTGADASANWGEKAAWRKSAATIFAVGDLLVAAQAKPPGQFEQIVERELPFGEPVVVWPDGTLNIDPVPGAPERKCSSRGHRWSYGISHTFCGKKVHAQSD